MSDLNVYLVPADEPSPKQRNIGKKILAYLEEKGIVDGFYDEEFGWYAPGPNSPDLFADADDPAFEYVIIYDERAAHFVPDNQSYGFGTKCIKCGIQLDEALYEI